MRKQALWEKEHLLEATECKAQAGTQTQVCLALKATLLSTALSSYHESQRSARSESSFSPQEGRDSQNYYFGSTSFMPCAVLVLCLAFENMIYTDPSQCSSSQCQVQSMALKRRGPTAKKLGNTAICVPPYALGDLRFIIAYSRL